MKVNEFMTRGIEYLQAGGTVAEAIEKMVDRRIRSLLVKKNDREGVSGVQGVITARDIVFKVLARGLDPRAVSAAEVSSSPLICIGPETTLTAATEEMVRRNIARVFICDGDHLLGVVALMDVMAASVIYRARGMNVS